MRVRRFNESSDWNEINDILNIARDIDGISVTLRSVDNNNFGNINANGYLIVIKNYSGRGTRDNDLTLSCKEFLTMCKDIYDRLCAGGYQYDDGSYVRLHNVGYTESIYRFEEHSDNVDWLKKPTISEIPPGLEISYCHLTLDPKNIIN